MRRPPVPPLAIAALAGAIVGFAAAVLLLRFGDPPGSGTFTRSSHIFAWLALPARWWMGMVLGWTSPWGRTLDVLVTLTLNGVVWSVALTALVRALRRSARVRRIAARSAVAGMALALLVWMVGMPVMAAWDGFEGLILLAQLPGVMLLALNGYDTHMYDGTFVGEVYRPGPVTLLLFSLANALLIAALAPVAGFTWRWIRTPISRRSPVAEG